MSDVIFEYLTPNRRGRSLGPARACQRTECGRIFRPPLDRKRQVFCSMLCANRDHAEKRWRERPRCARPGCGKRFKRRRLTHQFCSRECYDAVVVPGVADPPRDSAPVCCGEALYFATDFLGRTTQICRRCGERPVKLYGVHRYDQRAVLDDELDRKIATAQRATPQKVSAVTGDGWRQQTHKRGAA